jgi:hypothetical protein
VVSPCSQSEIITQRAAAPSELNPNRHGSSGYNLAGEWARARQCPGRVAHSHGFAGVITDEGAPSLRFLQGRERCCLYHEIFDKAKPGAAGRIPPTLRKEREEWGTRFLFCAGDFKGWATRPKGGAPAGRSFGPPVKARAFRMTPVVGTYYGII